MRIKGLLVARAASLYRADELVDDVREDGTLGDLLVRFSPFNVWYEINSIWEGRFLERTKPGAFKKTAQEAKRSDGLFSTKVMFDHGMDFNIGDKLLGVPNRFEEVNTPDYHGPELEAPLENTSYNRDLLPVLRKGGYGSSFMFETIREKWNHEPGESDHNPEGLPERDVEEVRTFEAGPVTWPASPTATAGMRSRSLTDMWMEQLQARGDRRVDDLVRSLQAFRAARRTPDPRFTPTPDSEESRRQVEEDMAARDVTLRRARLMALTTRRR